MARPKPIIVIVGETASGKSALAMELARRFNGEIISADSWAVYKGFDVGTAKPSREDQAAIPHHLIDVADPLKGFSAAIFKRLATRAIKDISRRGKLPILAGGTGLYIDSILYDYQFLPPPPPSQRKKLNSMSIADLQNLADDMGLDTTTIDSSNKRRVIRLIENNGRQPTSKPLRDNILILGLRLDKVRLDDNIKKRTEAMVNAGLEQEVMQLVDMYGWEVEPMKGIGYREWRAYFDGVKDFSETIEAISRSTTELVKKQRTWFKRNNSIQWVINQMQAVDLVTTFLNK